MGDPAMNSSIDVLRADDIVVSFNGVTALDTVSLHLERGQILGLIGGNGAGKTTLVNVISGFVAATSGSVRFNDRDLTRSPVYLRARSGIARTFQGVRPFTGLSVIENVEVPARATGLSWREARVLSERLIQNVGLVGPLEAAAETLSYGQLRKLAVARALATQPAFLLLDEPAAGLNETETEEMGDALLQVCAEYECGMILVEHDLPLVSRVCDTIQVLARGRTVAVAPPTTVFDLPAVKAEYFGVNT